MEKDQRINRSKGKDFFTQRRSKNRTSPLFSLRWYGLLIGIVAIIIVVGTMPGYSPAKSKTNSNPNPVLSDIELLGKYVFFDKISNPPRMACVTCHTPENGGTFGVAGVNLHQVAVTGADPHTAGNRKPPTNAYATFIPPFSAAKAGGNFWDGRSVGSGGSTIFPHTEIIGPECIDSATYLSSELKTKYKSYLGPTADQALNPFPNPVEQDIVAQGVCQNVASAKYAQLFEKAWGKPIDCSTAPYSTNFNAYQVNYRRIAVSLSAYQASAEVNSFSSKLDAAIAAAPKDAQGLFVFPLGGLTDQENEGHNLFYQNCAFFCHNSGSIGPNRTDVGERYTSSLYFNIGTPANPEIPGFDPGSPDLGLFNHTQQDVDKGLFKTPTMRNVDKRSGVGFTKAYTHNGWFKSLESIVHFYNTRDILPRCPGGITTEKDALQQNCWPAPEVDGTVFKLPIKGPGVIGNLGLTAEEEAKIVAYPKTLTDTYTAKAPKPYK